MVRILLVVSEGNTNQIIYTEMGGERGHTMLRPLGLSGSRCPSRVVSLPLPSYVLALFSGGVLLW